MNEWMKIENISKGEKNMRYKPEKIVNEVDYKELSKKEL